MDLGWLKFAVAALLITAPSTVENCKSSKVCIEIRVSVQGVKSLGDHFTCLCREFDFYEVKKIIIIFQKEKGNTFTLLIIFMAKSLQKEQRRKIHLKDIFLFS